MSGECDKCGSSEHTEAACAMNPWDIPEFDKRMEFMGLVEWDSHGALNRLVRIGPFWEKHVRCEDGVWGNMAILTQHEAACLIREDWRVKLWAQHRIHIAQFCGFLSVERDIEGQITEILCRDGKIRETRDAGEIMCFGDNIDAAQAAAVDALIAEKKDDE